MIASYCQDVLDGVSTHFDSQGGIVSKTTYDKGDTVLVPTLKKRDVYISPELKQREEERVKKEKEKDTWLLPVSRSKLESSLVSTSKDLVLPPIAKKNGIPNKDIVLTNQ